MCQSECSAAECKTTWVPRIDWQAEPKTMVVKAKPAEARIANIQQTDELPKQRPQTLPDATTSSEDYGILLLFTQD